MSIRWNQAATLLPPTVKVCGRNLLPFCLRHRVALEAIGSPVVNVGKPCTVTDLLFAARILSTYDLEESRKPLTLRERYLAIKYTLSPTSMVEEMVKLHNYLESQSLWPRFWEKKEKANAGGIPWHLTIVAGLIRFGCSYSEAWTMPEAEAVWIYIANCKAEGAKIDLITDDEFEAMERVKAAAKQTQQPDRN